MQNVKEAPDSVQTAVCWRDKLPRIGGGQGGKSTLNKSIVHFDIKPANIFLGGRHPNADREEFSAYPAAYLGDFGLARRPSPNPLTRYVGTRGFRAKEMTPQATRPCGEKTDVWTVGLSVYCLMIINLGLQGLSWDIPNMPKASHSDRYELAPQAEKNYSKTLCDLIVNQCLNPDYNRRPDFADIIDLCEDNIYFLQQLTDFYKVAGPVVRTALMNNQQTLNAAGLPREYHLRFKPDTEFPITA